MTKTFEEDMNEILFSIKKDARSSSPERTALMLMSATLTAILVELKTITRILEK